MSIFRADGVWPLADEQQKPVSGDLVLQQIAELDAFNEKAKAERFHAACEAAVAERLEEDLLLVGALRDTVAQLADRAHTASTKQKYLQLQTQFLKFAQAYRLPDGGHMDALPAKPALVATWLLEGLAAGKSHATLKVAAAAVSAGHISNNLPDPCQSLLVRAVIQRARRFGKSVASDEVQAEAER